ncbi:MAG: hypothetical protein CMG74_12990 [Candidatus Marinimicrobia bacterium]|mgnify:CR=1 FL=1|nr:hypothetical protein [Candidatus Neomarinimicrobiota bacterium]
MNIQILTECGNKLGFGHLYRCLSLYQTFYERKISVNLIVKSNSDISSLLRNINFEYNNWINNYSYKPNDIYIFDSITISQSEINNICNKVKKTVFFDDYNRFNYSSSVVIDSTVLVNKKPQVLCNDNLYLLDTKYTALRKEFWAPCKKYIRKSIKNILITFGGSDVRSLSHKLLLLLNNSFPNIQKTIIVGPDFNNKSEIQNVANDTTSLVFSPNSDQMKQNMIDSDICIASGGQTLYELASLGVPTIAIILGENQIEDTVGWHKKGFLLNSGWWDKNGLEKNILNNINKISNQAIRKKMSIIGQKNIDGKGTYRITDSIIKYFS